MRHASVRLISSVLVIALFIAGPAGLEAKGRRGALIILTKVDGAQVKGELIAVESDSLRLLRGGDILSIARTKINSVQILRRSKQGSGALFGFLTGATIGVMWGLGRGPDPIHGHPALVAGPIMGGVGALIGFLASPWGRVDSTLALAGVSSQIAAENWNALRAHSRGGRRAKLIRFP